MMCVLIIKEKKRMPRQYINECEAGECKIRIPREDIYCSECLKKAILNSNKE